MSNAQKLPLQQSLVNIARNGANQAIGMLGKGLPASVVSVNGSIVTVKFEVLSDYNLPHIDVPLATSAYALAPIQSGDKGIVLPCDLSIAEVCGLADGTADLTPATNLSALTFFPIGNKNWKQVDPNMYVITGLSDVMLRDNSHQLQLETEYASWVSLISQINSLLTTIAAQINAAALTSTGIPPVVLTPITSSTNPVKART